MPSCVIPARRDEIVSVRSGDVIVSPAPDVISQAGPAQTVISRPRHQTLISRSPGRVVESCHLRFIRSDPAAPPVPPAIEAVLVDDQWATMDSIHWESVGSMTWRVDVEAPIGTDRVSSFVAASHNGDGATPPDQVKWTKFGVIRFGSLSSQVDVVISPTGSGPKVALNVRAAAGCRVKVWRIQSLR
jgi:hypothetical protein